MIIIKNYIINGSLNIIKKSNLGYDEIKLQEIRYGLVTIYLLVSKLIIILSLALVFKILPECLIVMALYNFIRMPSYGIHASKSWICLLVSAIIFIFIPIICINIKINLYIKTIISIIGIILMYKNSPADTHKKPIINKKRRLIYKYISVFITFIYGIIAIITNNNFLGNALILTIIIQCIVISPITYKIFKAPYNNYLNYNIN